MLNHIIYSSIVIIAIILFRALFRGRIPHRLIYALWAIAFIRLVIPGTLFDIAIPTQAETILDQKEVSSTFQSIHDGSTTPQKESTNQLQTPIQIESPDKTQTEENVSISETNTTDWKTVVKIVYFAGASIVFVWLIFSEFAVWCRLKRSRKFLKKYRGVKVYISDTSVSPCTFGIIPSIYITSDTADSDDADMVLMHEFAHISHFDPLRSLLRKAVAVIYWSNPLVWVYTFLAARDAELACDEAVISKLDGKQRLNYAKMILYYAPRAKGSVAGFGGKPMKKRIMAITNKTVFKKLPIMLSLMIALTICTAGFTGCTESTDNKSSSAPTDETSDSTIPDDVLLLPTVNLEYVRSCKGGMNYTYEELVSMTPEEIGRMMLGPTTRYGFFYDYPIYTGNTKSSFVDSKGNTYTAINVEDDAYFTDFESLASEIRKYFSKDIAVELFSKNIYFEYKDELFMLDSVKLTDKNSLGTQYEIVSSSENEIVYKGTTTYMPDDDDYEIYLENPDMEFPEECYETKYTKYILSLQDGEWVFTYFEY